MCLTMTSHLNIGVALCFLGLAPVSNFSAAKIAAANSAAAISIVAISAVANFLVDSSDTMSLATKCQ